MRPRILILSTAYLPLIGGSELAIQHITDRLEEYDFDMVTGRYTASMAMTEHIGRVRVFRAGGRWSRFSLLVPKLLMPLAMAITAWRLTRKHPYVAVHAYQASQAAGAALVLKVVRPDLPLVVTLQEGKELDSQRMLIRWGRMLILRRADRITAISNHLAAFARRYARASVDVIPNGVDMKSLAPKQPKSPSPKKVIISVSRLVPKNGMANLIRALPFLGTDYKLMIVGEGPLRKELEARSRELQVPVEFVGSVPHERLPGYLHRADIFVRPSLSEGLGSAFLEAMAAGVPVVASNVGGIADFLVHEKTGLVCDPSDPENIASQITRMMTDDHLRKGIIERALSTVRERYDWDSIARQMGRVYHELANA